MIIYEVNLAIKEDAIPDFGRWLGPHIKEILAFPGFESAKWWQKEPEDQDEKGKAFWTVHYYVRDRGSLNHYLEHHAPRMRQDGIKRFGEKFSAWRRIFDLKGSFHL